MAVGLSGMPTMYPIKGFELGTCSAGIKYTGRKDLVVMKLCDDAKVAGVFTQNSFCAAPVQIARQNLSCEPRYLLINTGNANAGTGKQGYLAATSCCQALARIQGCDAGQVLPFSTGVIGEPLPAQKIIEALPEAVSVISENGWVDAANGILTTDTLPKGASVRFSVDGTVYHITGISKGAGMIKPNMATMLAYVATDAAVSQPVLQRMLEIACNRSFNRISIDGDTSTNDSCMFVATAAAENKLLDSPQGNLYEELLNQLTRICQQLAQAIVRDGEGATKFVEIITEGAQSQQEALDVAYTVAHSPLVKTALFASDPNWGRILAAVGRAGVENLDVNQVEIFLNDVKIVEGGARAESYTEDAGQSVMNEQEFCIRILLGRGNCSEKIWTTDLSYDYVKINAEYRT